MIEVAIVSMEEALEADGEALPDGSGTLSRGHAGREAQPGAQAGDGGGRNRDPGQRGRGIRHASHARPAPPRGMSVAMAASDLDARLTEVARQYDDVQAELALPETSTDPDAIRRLGRELARLEPVVAAFRHLQATREELAGAREIRDASDGDDELHQMAADEIDPPDRRRGAAPRGAQGPAPAARPERRPRRDHGDPGRRRWRRGGAVRR